MAHVRKKQRHTIRVDRHCIVTCVATKGSSGPFAAHTGVNRTPVGALQRADCPLCSICDGVEAVLGESA